MADVCDPKDKQRRTASKFVYHKDAGLTHCVPAANHLRLAILRGGGSPCNKRLPHVLRLYAPSVWKLPQWSKRAKWSQRRTTNPIRTCISCNRRWGEHRNDPDSWLQLIVYCPMCRGAVPPLCWVIRCIIFAYLHGIVTKSQVTNQTPKTAENEPVKSRLHRQSDVF